MLLAISQLIWLIATPNHMTNQGALKSTKALEGLHAVHVVSHSPFISEEIKDGELAQATCKRSAIESNQRLIMQ